MMYYDFGIFWVCLKIGYPLIHWWTIIFAKKIGYLGGSIFSHTGDRGFCELIFPSILRAYGANKKGWTNAFFVILVADIKKYLTNNGGLTNKAWL